MSLLGSIVFVTHSVTVWAFSRCFSLKPSGFCLKCDRKSQPPSTFCRCLGVARMLSIQQSYISKNFSGMLWLWVSSREINRHEHCRLFALGKRKKKHKKHISRINGNVIWMTYYVTRDRKKNNYVY